MKKCDLCSSEAVTVTTCCHHSFHIQCLRNQWSDKSLKLSCPCCDTPLQKVYQDVETGKWYVGFDTDTEWVACYTLTDNRLTTVCTSFKKWKRQGKRLCKTESLGMRSHIVVT